MAAHKLVLSARFQVIYLLAALLGYTSAYDGVCSQEIIGALQGVGGSDLLQPASNCVNNSDNNLVPTARSYYLQLTYMIIELSR